ncbi:hypothetical protein BOTBODRAFT_102774 [Botryobasidium botryosum FD-172 SS1]|uniref:Small RNA 2'-O-methyltransferase n=1 Tax=Botryobasidium botryosum (strain FD-172 SS1) TaxID=930990 RepID=A0A067N6H9_BOTB1|nr:hypothetical protein BOTBODRAFT_102774 [Botryobasidium botryosum FD-172 SS1]
MTDLEGESDQPAFADVVVRFDPPLWIQRRTWILRTLRKENVRKLLDVGCGEGSLLSVLCEPAPTRASSSLLFASTTSIHLSHMAGIDVDENVLAQAIADTAPRVSPPNARKWEMERPRWDPLTVEIWNGGFEERNESLLDTGFDCLASTEVVEHLPPDLLSQFLPTLLGEYQPRLLLLTTPNFSFNELFSAPGAPYSGYPDPTGLTKRVFRHHDHKREWTVDEFMEWCQRGAAQFGYTVEVEGLGIPVEDDPWGRGRGMFASQTAIFRRKGGASRVASSTPLSPHLSSNMHLLGRHIHPTHPSSGKPLTTSLIIEQVKSTMAYESRSGEITLARLWNDDDVAIACGGDPSILLGSLKTSPDFRVELGDDESIWESGVTWTSFVPSPLEEPEPSDSDVRSGGTMLTDEPDVCDEGYAESWAGQGEEWGHNADESAAGWGDSVGVADEQGQLADGWGISA